MKTLQIKSVLFIIMKKKMCLNLTLTFLFACLMVGTTFAQNITIEDGNSGHGYLENTTGYIGIRPTNSTHGLILRDHTGATGAWSGIRLVNDNNSDRMEFGLAAGTNYGKSLVLMQNNRVGIGTTNPQQKLHVAGHMRLSGNGSTYAFIENKTGFIGIRPAHPTHGLILRDHTGATTQWSGIRHVDNGSNDRLEFALSTYLNYGKSLVLTQNNRVGIGTSTPTEALDVYGNIALPDAVGISRGNLYLGGKPESGEIGMRLYGGNVFGGAFPGGFIDVKTDSPSEGLRFRIDQGHGDAERMRIRADGKVVIGGDNLPTPGNFNLYVDNGILTEEVKVATVNNWADYVFEEDYDLNSTEEVETFIKANKHLPNVPSAKEVSENGISMAEMDATLLRQVEELWLHMIELKKENEALKGEVETLKSNK